MTAKEDTATDHERKEYLVTATMPVEIEPDGVESWVEAYYNTSAHTELYVVDPETQETVWSLEDDQNGGATE